MKLSDAREFSVLLIQEHLSDKGWLFSFNNRKSYLGICDAKRKTIYLSIPYTEINDWLIMKNTVLHEIAHALEWESHKRMSHSRVWQKYCLQIGARPQRINNLVKNIPKMKYKCICPHCGYEGQANRISNHTYHKQCVKKLGFVDDSKFIYELNVKNYDSRRKI
jgi:predicted SprT family Zn-dependent metalloprotease